MQFLNSTAIPPSEIAAFVQAHLSQVYRWKKGKTTPTGGHLLRLVTLSQGLITSAATECEGVAKSP